MKPISVLRHTSDVFRAEKVYLVQFDFEDGKQMWQFECHFCHRYWDANTKATNTKCPYVGKTIKVKHPTQEEI